MPWFTGQARFGRVSVNAFAATAIAVGGVVLSTETVTAEPAGRQLAQPIASQQDLPAEAVLHQQINDAMGLFDSDLVTIAPAAAPGQAFLAQFLHDGQIYTLDAVPWTVRAEHYQVLVQQADGTFVPRQPGPLRTFRGGLLEVPGSDAAGSYQEDGLWAMIVLPDGERLWVEPAWRAVPAAGANLHVVYADRDRKPLVAGCGTLHDDIPPVHEDAAGAARGGLACGTGVCFAELANDADVEYFQDWGSESAVENRINSVVAAMNVQYENDVDITHVISAIVIRTAEPDPYSSTDSSTLVSQVRSEWETNLDDIPRDITQLFTGKEISGSTIGQAATIGGVCSSFSYSYSQSDCCGAFARTVELHAHENGHVWNGVHCSCSGFTMNTPLNQNPLGQFTAGNISRITSHRDSIGCLGTSAGLMLPFSDDFNVSTIDSANWSQNAGADINTAGNGEPSPPSSLNIDGSDVLTSNFIDLEPGGGAVPAVKLSYWWQRTGSGNSPEPGEDLMVEYLNEQNQWLTLRQYPGSGSDTDPFAYDEMILPSDARHSFFRIRFRGTSPNANADDWFIDDVLIEEVITPENNDTCGSNVVDVFDGVPKSFNTANASSNAPSEVLCGGQLENDIWYRYIPSCSGDVNIDICDANFDARLAVYFVVCPFSPDTATACDDNSCVSGEAELTLNVNAGSTYWIRIGAAQPDVTGTGTLTIECAAPATGACCMPDGSCSTQSGVDCASMGGSYSGDGIDCGSANCPQPEGACCMPDGSCTIETSADCASSGGAYQGDSTDCGSANCPQPCPADIADSGGETPDGQVDVFDLLKLLENWGTSGTGADIAAPTNTVDVFDLLALLDAWGVCD